MKKAMIALSAILVAAPVFAATTHATDDTVAAANANANTAKEKLHQAPRRGGIRPKRSVKKAGTPPNPVRKRAGIKPKPAPKS